MYQECFKVNVLSGSERFLVNDGVVMEAAVRIRAQLNLRA